MGLPEPAVGTLRRQSTGGARTPARAKRGCGENKPDEERGALGAIMPAIIAQTVATGQTARRAAENSADKRLRIHTERARREARRAAAARSIPAKVGVAPDQLEQFWRPIGGPLVRPGDEELKVRCAACRRDRAMSTYLSGASAFTNGRASRPAAQCRPPACCSRLSPAQALVDSYPRDDEAEARSGPEEAFSSWIAPVSRRRSGRLLLNVMNEGGAARGGSWVKAVGPPRRTT